MSAGRASQPCKQKAPVWTGPSPRWVTDIPSTASADHRRRGAVRTPTIEENKTDRIRIASRAVHIFLLQLRLASRGLVEPLFVRLNDAGTRLTDKHQRRHRNRRYQKRPKDQRSPVYFWDVAGVRLVLSHDVLSPYRQHAVSYNSRGGRLVAKSRETVTEPSYKAGSLTIRLRAKAKLISPSPARFARGCTWSIRKPERCLGLTKIRVDEHRSIPVAVIVARMAR